MNTKNVVVSKATIKKKSGMKIQFWDTQNYKESSVQDVMTMDRSFQPHDHLFTAFRLLVPHMLHSLEMSPVKITADYLKRRTVIEDIALESFRVTQISIVGGGDDAKVILTGKKFLKSGKAVALNTEAISLYNETNYDYQVELAGAIDNAFDEVKLFMAGKMEMNGQMSLIGSNNEDDI